MAPKYVSDSVKLLLKFTILLMFIFSTSSKKQSTPKKTERDGYLIMNVGIKLCQLKCEESGQCLSVEYNSVTLTCRLSIDESTNIKKKEGFVILARGHSHVRTASCTSSMCSFNQRCLKTRSGKAVCVQDEKHNGPEKSPQPKVDKQESFANSPLHEACWKGDLNQDTHLSRGLVDIRDKKNGKTPLMVAAQEGHCKLFQCLIRKGANISEVDNDGKNALHWACKGGHAGMWECVLQQYEFDINAGKMQSLVHAVYRADRDLYEFFVCMGANVSSHYKGMTILHFACTAGRVSMVQYVLTHSGLDINIRGKGGVTSLMACALMGKKNVFDFLVRRGANVSLVDEEGNTILHHVARRCHAKMALHITSKRFLDVNSLERHGMTPLMTAAFFGCRKVFDLLVRKGGLVDLVDGNGGNILHLASSGGRVEMVKYILSRELVDINARDKDGRTAAMISKRKRKMNVFDFLVSKGCLVK